MKKPITVYWSPGVEYWNLLYPEPKTVIQNLIKHKNNIKDDVNFFSCPAVTNKGKRTYSFEFPMSCGYEWDYSNFDTRFFRPIKEKEPSLGFKELRPPTVFKSPQIAFQLSYLFFCEESLEASFTPPYFCKPNYTKHAVVGAGNMDIGQWFRPYAVEMTFWEEKGSINFKNGEPLLYVEFLTNRPVILKRFSPNEKILQYASACASASKEIEKRVPLIERYKRFNDSKMNKLIMKEIKENIV